MTKPKNDARSTWKLASYQAPERRKTIEDRREPPKRTQEGERRKNDERTLKTLLRF
jgi:hypothetical protein